MLYSHYDVISARGPAWESDPFTLSARNGYLYGRGATDNKGPIMAVACAAAEMLQRKALELDLVMLLEGEEEAGSGGFMETVKRKKVCAISRVFARECGYGSTDGGCVIGHDWAR